MSELGRREFSKLVHEHEEPAEQPSWVRYNSDGGPNSILSHGQIEYAKPGIGYSSDEVYTGQAMRTAEAASQIYLPKVSVGENPQAMQVMFAEVAGPGQSYFKAAFASFPIQFDEHGGFKAPFFSGDVAHLVNRFDGRARHAGQQMEWKHYPYLRSEKV